MIRKLFTPKFLLLLAVFVLLLMFALPQTLISSTSDIDTISSTASFSSGVASQGPDTSSSSLHTSYPYFNIVRSTISYTTGSFLSDSFSSPIFLDYLEGSVDDLSDKSTTATIWIIFTYADGSTADSNIESHLGSIATLERMTNPFPEKAVSSFVLKSTNNNKGDYEFNTALLYSFDSLTSSELYTLDLAPDTFNRLAVTYDVTDGSAVAFYSLDGSTWTAIDNSVSLSTVSSSSSLYLKFSLTGADVQLSNIDYLTSYVESTPTLAIGKTVLGNAIESSSVSFGSSFSPTFDFSLIINFFKNIFTRFN